MEALLAHAEEKEKEFDWMGAVPFYEKTLSLALKQKNFLKTGEVQDKMGFCFRRAATQAETAEEFENRARSACEAYGKAAELFANLGEAKRAEINHCKAMALYVNSWLSADLYEKKKFLDEGCRLEKEVLKARSEAGDSLGYGKACNELVMLLYERLYCCLLYTSDAADE